MTVPSVNDCDEKRFLAPGMLPPEVAEELTHRVARLSLGTAPLSARTIRPSRPNFHLARRNTIATANITDLAPARFSHEKQIQFLWWFFRNKNREAHCKQELVLDRDILRVKKASRTKRRVSWGKGEAPLKVVQHIFEAFRQTRAELKEAQVNPASHEFKALSDNRTFALSMLFDQMLDHPWLQGVFAHHPSSEWEFFNLRLEHRLEEPIASITQDLMAWYTHAQMLEVLAITTGNADGFVQKTDWGQVNALEMIGIREPGDPSKDCRITADAMRTLDKLTSALRAPLETYIKDCQKRKKQDAQAGRTDTDWDEMIRTPDLGRMEKWLATPFTQFFQRQNTAIGIVRKLFDEYCDKNFVKTYQPSPGKNDLEPEHRAWNRAARAVLAANDYPHFYRQRRRINRLFNDFATAHARTKDVLQEITTFLIQNPVPDQPLSGQAQMGTPLPRLFHRFSDGGIDRRPDRKQLVTPEDARLAKEWKRWQKKKK